MSRAILKKLWTKRPVSLIVFAVSLVVMLVFVIRLMLATIYWSDPEHIQQVPQRWMTPGYLARSWELDHGDVALVLGLDPKAPPRRQTIEEIAATQGRDVDDLLQKLTTFLAAQQ